MHEGCIKLAIKIKKLLTIYVIFLLVVNAINSPIIAKQFANVCLSCVASIHNELIIIIEKTNAIFSFASFWDMTNKVQI